MSCHNLQFCQANMENHKLPKVIVTDNGPEFTSRAMLAWADENNIRLHFVAPVKLTQNAFIESFNGKFRDECLNQNWFLSIDDARKKVDTWRRDYNGFRPHSFQLLFLYLE